MANLKDINYGIGKYLELSDASAIPDIGTNRQNLDLLNFKVATNNAYSLYNFKDGMIDAYQTEGGVDTATSTGESYDSANKTYGPTEAVAYSFTSTGASTWTCPAGLTEVEVLVVSGGGGGGSGPITANEAAGGAGAGGVVHHSTYTVVPGVVYDITVGAGGAGGTGNNNGVAGSNSVFNVNAEGSGATMTAVGGGYGGGAPTGSGNAGGAGGSGGGGGYFLGGGGSGTQADSGGGTGYGNNGGVGDSGAGGAGGGGGAGAVGGTSTVAAGAAGGAGRLFSNFTSYGVSGYFAGGGGGGGSPGGAGGTGGGGAGGYNTVGVPGTANTGGGGGGGEEHSGGAGGSGVVLIYSPLKNMTLLSNTQTAQADPTEGRLVLYEEDVDAITLDTDLKGYVSRDNGTTYTQTPLVLDSTITHPTSLLLHCDGANNGVVFTDSSYWQHPATVSGDVHTDTAVKKFGTASAQFDGTGDDHLDYASSPTFGFGTGDWTIDFWIYGSASGFGSYGNPFDMRPGANQTGSPRMFLDTGNSNIAAFNMGGSGTQCSSNVAMVNETWYHIAVVKCNNVTKVYTDGVTGASGTYPTEYADTIDYRTENLLRIGDTSVTADAYALKGYLDEFRITKGVARWTANFTPDTSPYTGTEGSQRLLSGSVDISGQPAGSIMKYKVETLNSKNLKLHGASLLWA